ncbi:hypothetical protein VTJ04DRAFT_9980 [Mycothermus thermophilus]|uniref:uncharacterized protein n=1 Tax=Humicola insolens TaxID=85995 RepID=UPI003743F3A7
MTSDLPSSGNSSAGGHSGPGLCVGPEATQSPVKYKYDVGPVAVSFCLAVTVLTLAARIERQKKHLDLGH